MTTAGLPVHFVPPGTRDRVDIAYSRTDDPRSAIWIRMDDRDRAETRIRVGREEGLPLLEFGPTRPGGPRIVREEGRVRIDNDLIRTGGHFLSGEHDRAVPLGPRDCRMVEESLAYREKILHRPILDLYALFLGELLAERYQRLLLWPPGKSHGVALSHDVDYPEMVRWIEIPRYLVREKGRARPGVIGDILTGRNNFWRFEEWAELEAEAGFRSAHYLCGRRGSLPGYLLSKPDPFYDVGTSKFRTALGDLVAKGFEIGVHLSYDAYLSTEAMKEEVGRVAKASGSTVLGGRHHCWRVNPDNPAQTAARHDRAGLLYDTSICYEQRAGFRYASCHPFRFFSPETGTEVPTVQLPTCLMDDHLFGYAGLGYQAGPEAEIEALLASVREVGGIFLADYHLRVLNQTFFPGWADTYRYLLARVAADSEAFSDTPANLARRWVEFRTRLADWEIDEDRRSDD